VTRALFVLVLLVGCGGAAPTIAWYGRSPDGAHRASVIEEPATQRLVVDGRVLGTWRAIGLSHLTWSARGIVVPVSTEEGWHVWSQGELGPPHDAVGELHVTATELVYAARSAAGWLVVVNGSVGSPHESIRAGSIVLERGHVAYVARDARGDRAVIDEVPGPAFRRVERLGFAGKGERVVYVAYEEEGARVVIDGEPGDLFDAVHELALAPREPRWAAIVEQHGELWLLRDGARTQLPRGTRDLALSDDGSRIAWVTPTEAGARVWLDNEPQREHADVVHLRFVPSFGSLYYVAHGHAGVRAVWADSVGPRFDVIEPPVMSDAGHVGYVAHRRAGSAVVIDGELVFRGEWSSPPVFAATGDAWAFVIRRAGRRYVVTPRGRTEVSGPFVDTLVLDEDGAHWAIATADDESRRLRIVVDGDDAAPLDMEEIAAQVAIGRDGAEETRRMVASELARARRSGSP